MKPVKDCIQISPEEFEAAGGDPMNVPRIREAMGIVAEEAEAEYDEIEAESGKVSADDLADGFVICGRPCRSLSAGVIGVLQQMRHPMFSEDSDHDETTVFDIASLLFVLSHPSTADLVTWVDDGTINQRAKVFAFELTADELATAEQSAQRWIDSAGRQMTVFGSGDGKKKARTG